MSHSKRYFIETIEAALRFKVDEEIAYDEVSSPAQADALAGEVFAYEALLDLLPKVGGRRDLDALRDDVKRFFRLIGGETRSGAFKYAFWAVIGRVEDRLYRDMDADWTLPDDRHVYTGWDTP